MLLYKTESLLRTQITALLLLCIGNLLLFIALLTPAWQVAEDTDAHRYVQSGLWMYCPGGVPCWYIFSDNLINYYEKVDVCRFLLIGDCRKKLIRTPYFFGWHYAVLILLLLSFVFGIIASGFLLFSIFRRGKARVFTVIFTLLTFCSFLLLVIGLAVFMINAEMLESRFLIGIKNTFKKKFGYSYYLAGLACMFLMFSLLAGIMVLTYIFFTKLGRNYVKEVKFHSSNHNLSPWNSFNGFNKETSQKSSYPTIPVFENVFEHPPRPGSNTVSQSVTPQPQEYLSTTRTFYSY
ncbi:unnamed protein product [Thelazia callipaeda]|uniref:Uncharacterized protein n=1 Tax=Thelazia callipaeda TaxID=103827 RepID=A0A0N5CVM0_THECL|nr:unnamed protein product [Thelazia callipaeda]